MEPNTTPKPTPSEPDTTKRPPLHKDLKLTMEHSVDILPTDPPDPPPPPPPKK